LHPPFGIQQRAARGGELGAGFAPQLGEDDDDEESHPTCARNRDEEDGTRDFIEKILNGRHRMDSASATIPEAASKTNDVSRGSGNRAPIFVEDRLGCVMMNRLLLVTWASLFTLATTVALADDAPRASLPTVAVITTGGTIAEKTDPKTGGAVPAVSGKDLVAAVPGLEKVAKVVVVAYSDIDSSHMTPELWAGLSQRVDKVLSNPKIVGAVVTHGTDTMAAGSFFLDATLKTNKPVVFTGAMNDASSANPDGPGNILNAVIQATSKNAQNWGVTVTLNRYINSASEVRKTHTTNPQTFESGEKGYLGYVFGDHVVRINERVGRIRIPLPKKLPKKLPKVPLIAAYAGADGSLVRAAVDGGAEGLVVEGVGAGNVNAEINEAIHYALAKKIPVVITTRVYNGAVEPVYGDQGGGRDLVKEGAMLGGALISPKARLLLIIALLKHGNDQKAIKRVFSQVRGASR